LRRRPPERTSFLALLLAAAAAHAQPPGTPSAAAPAADAADGYEILESFLADVRSLKADFTQEVRTADDERLLEKDTGTLAIQRPNRFRWSSEKPTQFLVVADGANVWTYDVELEQVTVGPLDESITSSPAMLLSGDRNVRDAFHVVATERRDGLDWVTLEPKAEGSDFSSLTIGFDERHAPQKLEFTDGLNETTRITLDNVVVNPELDAAQFDFEPPAGANLIGDPR
jgi:outer membrane lipoprotein carrier protein